MSNVTRLYRRRIGEILVNQGTITNEQLEQALSIQKGTGELLGAILQELGLVAESDIAKTICIQYQLPFINLCNYECDPKALQLLPKEFLNQHQLLPFDRIGDTLLIMVTEIPSDSVLAEIPKRTKLNAALYVGFSSEVQKYLAGPSADGKAAATSRSAAIKEAAKAKPPAAAPATPAMAAGTVRRIEIPDDDDEDGQAESRAATASKADSDEVSTADDAVLVFGGDGKSLLAELDSTWDSIFTEPQSKDETKIEE